MSPLLLSAVLLGAAGLLLLLLGTREFLGERQIAQRLGAGADTGGKSLLDGLGARTLVPKGKRMDNETRLLLNRLGWRRASQRTLFFSIQIGLPLLLGFLVAVLQWLFSNSSSVWVALLFALGIGYLIPKRVLASAAARRQQRLGSEIYTLIPMLRMLFEVGMTVEQALRVLATEARHILPELSIELRQLLLRVDAGLDLGQELRYSASLVEVDEVTDCFAILEQLTIQGGGAMASLLALQELLADRRMTTLQERVSKLSAKMSAVMVAFLFPALMIVLAGPGFIAIFKALGDMR